MAHHRLGPGGGWRRQVPGLASAALLSAAYGRLTHDTTSIEDQNSGTTTYVARDRPVWLLTYAAGFPSFGPRGNQPPTTETNVVIDAGSGEYLFSYTYR